MNLECVRLLNLWTFNWTRSPRIFHWLGCKDFSLASLPGFFNLYMPMTMSHRDFHGDIPVNTRLWRWRFLLGQRQRRWARIKPASGQPLAVSETGTAGDGQIITTLHVAPFNSKWYPSKQDTLTKRWYDVGTEFFYQYWINIYNVYWGAAGWMADLVLVFLVKWLPSWL